ncbi:MAG: DedA family protein [Rubrobacter sp.]|nr:DedA family protein [Rubrobacter sp.]
MKAGAAEDNISFVDTVAFIFVKLSSILPNSPEELQILIEALIEDYGYFIVFLGTALDFGLPSSGDITMLLGGWFASGDDLNIALVMLFGALGAAVSENAMYWTGRKGGRPIVERMLRVRFLFGTRGGEHISRIEKYFAGHGGKTIFVGRLVPGFRALIPLSAGMSGMPYGRFLAFDCIAIIFWAVLMGTIGYVFGEYWEAVISVIRALGPVAVGVIVALLISLYIYRRRRRKGRP